MRKLLFVGLFALLAWVPSAHGQTPFARTGLTVSRSASTSSANVALVTGSSTVWVCNTGSNTVYINFGDSTVVASATAGTPLIAGQCGNLSPAGGTHMAAITDTGTSTVLATPGTGAVVASGGGSGSGGSATAANQATEISSLASIDTKMSGPIPTQAPTVSIGGVGIIDSAGTNVATVKAASTAPVATDKPVVVTLSQNAGLGASATPVRTDPVGTTTQPVSIATAPALVASTADVGNVGGRTNVTPTNCGGTVTTGGTAQNAFTAQSTLRGMMIANLDTTEIMWISFTSTAAAADTQSYPLPPGAATTYAGFGSYSSQFGFGVNTALSVIAATTGHKWACTRW